MQNTKVLERRLECGLTQQKVAELAKVAIRTYQLTEKGLTFPKTDTAIRIANALGTTTEDLFVAYQ